jgi:hypothetical protein
MDNVFLWWIIAAIVMIVLANFFNKTSGTSFLFRALIDGRGRMSLSQFQILLWTIIVFSLIIALVISRAIAGVDPLAFAIPDEILLVLGISAGSKVLANAVKTNKDKTNKENIIDKDAQPHPTQMFKVEEGDQKTEADNIDIIRLQNLMFTIILAASYVLTVIMVLKNSDSASIASLPGFNATMVTLLGISHAGYISGKLPTPKPSPQGK